MSGKFGLACENYNSLENRELANRRNLTQI